VLTYLVFVALCVWLLEGIEKNSEDFISAKNNIAIFNAQINEIENFKKNYDAYEPNLEKMDQLFVDPANPVDFIKFLEDTASGSQITSQIFLPPSSDQASQDFIAFQLISKGSFSDVSSFLKKIELGPYLIEIENLTIQNDSTGNSATGGAKSGDKNIPKDYSSRKVNATFTINAFVKK
jgi:Tfp pilus assembly protein PilO